MMNLYLRYFDSETLVTNVNDALAFLSSIPEIGFNDRIAEDVRQYFESDNRFPKRYKVRPKIYFIMIKTDANNMREFKDYRARSVSKANDTPKPKDEPQLPRYQEPERVVTQVAADYGRRDREYQNTTMALYSRRFGWYEGVCDFKRVTVNPVTGKNEYRDTHFVARCKAVSGIDCYNRIIEHLRSCVDERSQFPSPKGGNFAFAYLGECKPLPNE